MRLEDMSEWELLERAARAMFAAVCMPVGSAGRSLLYDNHDALGLDPAVIKLDTLRVDIAVELENRRKPSAPAADGTPAGM
jgi:hypothetical protein